MNLETVRLTGGKLTLLSRRIIRRVSLLFPSLILPKKIISFAIVDRWVSPDEILYIIWQGRLPKNLLIESKIRSCIRVAGNWDETKEVFEDQEVYKSFVDHFVKGRSWLNTQYYRSLCERADSKVKNPYKAALEQLQKYDVIYEKIRDEGFDIRHPLLVHIGRKGEYIRHDGAHRLAIAKILKIDKIPVKLVLIYDVQG